jgi:hypothetical protein
MAAICAVPRVEFFRAVRFSGDWEWSYIGKRWQVRLGRSQIAVWRDLHPLFCWLGKRAR